jgi:hypothetical protein
MFAFLILLVTIQPTHAAEDYYYSFQSKNKLAPHAGEYYFPRTLSSRYTKVSEYTIDDGSKYETTSMDLTRAINNIIVTQSSDYDSSHKADKAVDNIANWHWSYCAATRREKAWLRFDFGKEYRIDSISVRNRGDSSGHYLNNFRVIAGSDYTNGPHKGPTVIGENMICSKNAVVKVVDGNRNGQTLNIGPSGMIPIPSNFNGERFDIPCSTKARYVWIDLGGSTNYLMIADVNIFAEETKGYGWNIDQTSFVQDNNAMNEDMLVQGSIRPQEGSVWELQIPTGTLNIKKKF